MDSVPLVDCKHGTLYRLSSRNLSHGVFNEQTKGFVGIREKFGSTFLFTEYHWDTGPPHGTASPLKDLGPCPITDLSEYSNMLDGRLQTNHELFAWLEQAEKADNDIR